METTGNIIPWQRAVGWWNKCLNQLFFSSPREWYKQILPSIGYLIFLVIGQTIIGLVFILRAMLRAMNKNGDARVASLCSATLAVLVTIGYIRVGGWSSVDRVIDHFPGMNSLPDKGVDDYINRWSATAVSQMHQFGVPASITLAQAINESNHGTSRLANEGRNHFGIKCAGGWSGRTMLLNDDKPNECFRVYDEDEQSFEDYAKFLRKHPRYANLFSLPLTNYQGWAYGLRAAGYASDKKYPQKLISLIEKYDLDRFDRE